MTRTPGMLNLTKLVDTADGAGYTLPDALLDAWRTYVRVKALPIPDLPRVLDSETAAARVVAATAAGEPTDLHALGVEVHRVEADQRAHDAAVRILADAIEQAEHAAVTVAADLTETIIGHLRAALDDVHKQARAAAAELDGYDLADLGRLLTAPAKTRAAYTDLQALVARRQAIYQARRWANQVGGRVPERDVDGIYSEFERPLALAPGWRQPAPIPRLPAPTDPAERLLWVVSADGDRLGPWMPTCAEQDQAWWSQFGDGVTRRATGALAARAHAGQRV